MNRLKTLAVCTALFSAASTWGQVALSFSPKERGHVIGDLHYGIFFEEINHAGDGGLYAELIRNRSFEDNDYVPEAWSAVGDASISLTDENLMNAAQRHALSVSIASNGEGIRNDGFWGMNFTEGGQYNLSLWVKNAYGYDGDVCGRIMDDTGQCIGQTNIHISDAEDCWRRMDASIVATASCGKGVFELVFDKEGELLIDMVSLFPADTYRGRANGCRRDLAEKLEAMHPAFVRFPGGCYIEGEWRNDKPHFNGMGWTEGSSNRFEWKQTIGPVEQRPGHWNVNWNYRVSDGLGFHEMLQLTEDLGAEPLFVVNIGMGHGWCHPYNDIDEYIQEAIDALEYCNGDATTKYGAMRIANGHPAPFNMRLIEIGNENYNFNFNNNSDQSDHYAERYIQFYNAIKARYPECICIGNVESWGTDNPSWRNDHPVDAVDEHYYRDPSWFVNQYEKYDNYDRDTMKKVYAGEYAVTSGFGSTGNLAAALGEAIYMQGMEKNSDICIMGSYAPIFVNENDQKWMPDMIRFNSHESYGTPSYYVQQLMPSYVGKHNISWTESNNNRNSKDSRNIIGLSSWNTTVEYSDVTIAREDGTSSVLSADNSQYYDNGGTWTVNDYKVSQGDRWMQGKMLVWEEETGEKYKLRLTARKTAGDEGFLVAFKLKDADKDFCWWNIGGWNNTRSAIEICTDGAKRTITEKGLSLDTDRDYNLDIEVNGNSVKCYLDGNLIHAFTIATHRHVYVSASIDDDNDNQNSISSTLSLPYGESRGESLYIKLTNPNADDCNTLISLDGYKTTGGKLIQMKAGSGTAENTGADKYKVAPTEQPISIDGGKFLINIPAYSFNILELNVHEANNDETICVGNGIYYIRRADADLYLSRGADWGTRATFDNIGVPVHINTHDGAMTIRYLDSNKYLGKDGEPYTDKDTSFPINWHLVMNADNQLILQNATTGEYLTTKQYDADGAATFTTDAEKATPIEFVSVTAHDTMTQREQREDATCYEGVISTDITNISLQNPDMSISTEGWDVRFSGKVTANYGVTETFQSYGYAEQTIKGLVPGSVYRLTMPALYRSASNSTMTTASNSGCEMGNAVIYCGSKEQQVIPWSIDRKSDSMPNNMEEAAQCFNEGLYSNSIIGRADDDGNLTIGIRNPQYNPACWLIWGKVKLEKLTQPVDYTHLITNPSFEDWDTGWDTNMQRQNNGETSAMKHGTYYYEKWTSAPGTISDAYAMQTLTGLPMGKYRITAACHAELQGSNVDICGVSLMANGNMTPVSQPQDYNVYADVTDGTITIGYQAISTNANWVTVDNFRIYWIGDGEDIIMYRNALDMAIQQLRDLADTKTILTPSHRDHAQYVIDAALEHNGNVEEIKQSIDNVNSCYNELYDYRLDIERNDPYKRYLFAYFPSNNDENLYYAVSENGFDYTPLNNGQRVMASDTVAIKHAIRDPHILRGKDGSTFYMVATDMKSSEGWSSNRGIVMYRSKDLIHWQHSTVHFPTRFPDKWSNVTRVWAPETIWDPDYQNEDGTKGRYMVYFSLLTNDGTCQYDKVYYSYANDTFTDLMIEPQFLYDRGSATIDADIVYDDCDNMYHMIYKNEGSGGICHVTTSKLTAKEGTEPGCQWSKPSPTIQQTDEAVEGGGLFRLINTNRWVVMYDCYANGHYQFCTTNDWQHYTFQQNTYTSGAFTPRHGTVIPITPYEYNQLIKAFPTIGLTQIDDPVGIDDTAVTSTTSSTIYNIAGQRVNTDYRGIVIIGNKKVKSK